VREVLDVVKQRYTVRYDITADGAARAQCCLTGVFPYFFRSAVAGSRASFNEL